MHLYTDDGDYDGFTVFETGQITEVFWGNREHRAISHLVAKGEAAIAPTFKSNEFQDIIIELNTEFENLCFHESGCEDNFDIGYIENHDEKWLKIHTFSVKKSLSRMYKLILRDSISRIVINSPYQNKDERHSADCAVTLSEILVRQTDCEWR